MNKPCASVGPGFFYENWLGQAGSIKDQGGVIGHAGDGQVGYLAVTDIGLALANCVHNDKKYKGKTINISGPSLSDKECLAMIGKAIGKTLGYHELSKADYEAKLTSFGVPANMVWLWGTLEVPHHKDACLFSRIVGCQEKGHEEWH